MLSSLPAPGGADETGPASPPPAPAERNSLSSPLFRLSPADLRSRRLSELSASDEDFAFLDPADDLSMEEQLMRRPGVPARPARTGPRAAAQVRGALLPGPRAAPVERRRRLGRPAPVADVVLRRARRRAALREDGGEDGVLLSNREREGIRT